MFKKTHTRLTILFTGLMVLFLSAFAVISYFSFSFILYRDSKYQTLELAEQEAQEHRHSFEHDFKKKEHIDYNPQDSSFYYIVRRDGQVIGGDESFPTLRVPIMERLVDWHPGPDEVRIEEFKLEGDKKIYMVIAGRAVYKNGDIIGAIYAGKDITQQRMTLNRLTTVLGIIAALFAIVSSALGYYMAGHAMRPIARSFARQREFVADASHELRTPLSILHSSLEVLDSEEREHLSPFSQQIMDDMKDEVARMRSLAENLLTLARADSGALEVTKETFDLCPIAEKLVRSFQPLLSERGQTLELNTPEKFVMYADKERITQLLCILLDNARKYTPQGGQITLRLYETRKGKERMLCIDVQDTGIGIPPEEQTRIFDRFYRVDKVRSRELGSTGLGLSIASWIVRVHQGVIRVQSEPGNGSTFTVQFPAKYAGQAGKRL
ncbi:sensor histidine kinase [Aneurinibacillus danicus]|uniref:histidine kinase n=1 Tax=Aneurinibacillus danicus TaxID=267746 RepID=A0A511V1W8_9BACL|nr:ATP-binding protein [Aneurinibacillus danicus]GEN32906.1 two-component sensor histidine kinase [Aneurinibacillus danicus]